MTPQIHEAVLQGIQHQDRYAWQSQGGLPNSLIHGKERGVLWVHQEILQEHRYLYRSHTHRPNDALHHRLQVCQLQIAQQRSPIMTVQTPGRSFRSDKPEWCQCESTSKLQVRERKRLIRKRAPTMYQAPFYYLLLLFYYLLLLFHLWVPVCSGGKWWCKADGGKEIGCMLGFYSTEAGWKLLLNKSPVQLLGSRPLRPHPGQRQGGMRSDAGRGSHQDQK